MILQKCQRAKSYRHAPRYLAFDVGPGDPNLDPQDYVAASLPAESSPQPLNVPFGQTHTVCDVDYNHCCPGRSPHALLQSCLLRQ